MPVGTTWHAVHTLCASTLTHKSHVLHYLCVLPSPACTCRYVAVCDAAQDFICASNVKKLKHEDGFEDKEFRYPYLGDPYAAARDQVMRAKW